MDYIYNYNNEKYRIIFYDSPGQERFRSIALNLLKTAKIVIYLFDLTKDNDVDELFINQIREKMAKNSEIYLIGNKIDITRINIEKYRKQAKLLIDRGKINKYFELSAKTGEGIRLFEKIIQIDAAILIEEHIPDNKVKLNEEIKRWIKLDKYYNSLEKYLNL